jgi:aminopeptidase N
MTGPRRTYAVGTAAALLLTVTGLSPAAAAPAPVAGEQTSGDSLFPNTGNGGYDVQHYDIALAYSDYTGSIDATTTIDATAEQPLSSFSLDFEGLTIGSVTVDGQPARHVRENDAGATKHKLVITPLRPVDGDFTTVVTYRGVPTEHIDPDGSSEGWIATTDGATVVNEPVGAMTLFPNNNTVKDKATFDVTLDVPASIGGKPAAGVSNGELVSNVVTGGRSVWTWRQSEQMATYLSMISIGAFTVHENDIALGGGRTIKEYSFIDAGTSPENLAEIEANRALLGPMLRYLEKKFGPYPGNSTGILVDNTEVGYALETQDRPFFETSVDTSTLLHELAHQWFGNAVSADDWSDLWLSEGPATYLEAQYAFDTGATDRAPATVFHDEWNGSSAGEWAVPMAGFADPADLFGGQTYDRGARSLQALRTLVGDQAFDATLSTWIARRSGSTGSTADWIALAEEISGRDLTAFYQDWAYDTDKPAWPPAYTAPLVSGRVAVGQTLTVSPGEWHPAAGLTYQWLADGVAVPGATGPRYVPSAAVRGKRLTVVVTGIRGTYAPVRRTSAASVPIAAGRQVKHPTPRISGTPKVHRTLRVRPGRWDSGTRLSYRWYVDGRRLRGGHDGSLHVPRSAKGGRIRVRVTSTKPGYETRTELSARTARVR